VQFSVPIVGVIDNGTESWGTANITSSGIISFGYESAVFTTWTGSGNKGFAGAGATYPTITYDLTWSVTGL
jgi:hypothetical protein